MTVVKVSDWINALLGPSLVNANWTIESLSDGAAVVTNQKGDQVILCEKSADNPGEDRPRILVVDKSADDFEGGAEFCDIVDRNTRQQRMHRAITNGMALDYLQKREKEQELTQRRSNYELRELIDIGKSLSATNKLDELLDAILRRSRHLIGADAGSIYVVEEDNEGPNQKLRLRFKLSQNDSIEYQSKEFVIPVSSSSIAGAAVVMKETVNIENVEQIPKDAPYQFDASFDQRTGYQTRSVAAVPMFNQNGDVLGVVQLINRKHNPAVKLESPADFQKHVIPMDQRCLELVETLASQAGVALENTLLYEEINTIFDGFVRASVHTIELRDPTTSGHSFRVAALTRKLAEVVANQTEGPFKNTTFSKEELNELETAALLHDFGKVCVREEVLMKAKKLYPPNLRIIRARIDFIRRTIENDHLQRRLMMIESGTPEAELNILDQAGERAVAEIDECWRIINSANEPTVLESGDFAKVELVGSRTYFDLNGNRKPYLEKEELDALLVAKGSLTNEELKEIRSHAEHTISFLEMIPWGKSMRNIPQFAGCHHEKLDGTGYPNKLSDKQIPLPSKIMAVADIFDALTASDRPYKKAVSLEKALQILDFEVKDNHIDRDLVDLFKKAEVFRVIKVQQHKG